MLSTWVLFLVSLAYVALLFAIAHYGDRQAQRLGPPARRSWVYSLALAVYCTSWTFYGAVGRAATSGWDFLPINLGPVLMFIAGYPLITRIVEISKRHNITSIADFIGARYGRHQNLAMLVTLIAVIGVLPYIALQLKAVAFSFQVLAGPGAAPAHDNALVIAVLLAIFAILFGTRQVVSSETHHGMMLAIAFESVVKLLAFLAVGLYVVFGIYHGLGDAYTHALALPQVSSGPARGEWQIGFITQTLLAMSAVLCLPRQFQVTVVENTSVKDIRAARWIFPLYLGLISLLVLPIAAAGLQLLPDAIADTYVLALPMAGQHQLLALAAYVGGFSAATSMVIVACIALSTMLCNEVVMPLLLRLRGAEFARGRDLSGLLKRIRRAAIVIIVALAYLYYRLFVGPGTLASIGLLSFSAVAQFVPALVGGVYWRRGSYAGALAGMLAGFAVWLYTLLLPTLVTAADAPLWHAAGPLGLGWLRPQALFGFDGLDPLTHGALWSLLANAFFYVAGSWFSGAGLHDRLQLVRFLGDTRQPSAEPGRAPQISATVGDLQELLERFLGPERSRSVLSEYAARGGMALRANERAQPALLRHTEHLLAGALGTSSARLVLASALRGRDMQIEDVIGLLDETSHVIQFNRELLRATLEHLSQGVSVVDAELRLVAWNRRYVELLDYPPELIVVGRPIEELVRHNAQRGLLGAGDAEQKVARRLEHMRAGHAYMHQRELPGGIVLEIRGNPMPGGGFVTSYSDVTAYKRSERQLQDVNESLESRVDLRTRELKDLNAALEQAKLDAERADQAKTRFLAAASHDLVQPLNAARLFLSSLERQKLPGAAATLVGQVESSFAAAETLLAGLLDISRLDAQAQEITLEHFKLGEVLLPLAAEFELLARENRLRFDVVGSSRVVHSDPRLLRRILQNFLSNAVRYTWSGRIVLGCRRAPGGAMRIEVWDTGPGIPDDKQREIFEEFRRLEVRDAHGQRGLGLGLAIVERIARLLGHPLEVRSQPGRGSVFSVTVPGGDAAAVAAPARRVGRSGGHVAGARVLCLENEPAVLAGMESLLSSWGCQPIGAADPEAARDNFEHSGVVPDLVLIDYHLDHGVNGVHAIKQLQELWGRAVPGIVITADHTQQAKEEAAVNGYALLPKPVKPAALRALMTRLLGANRAQAA